MNHIPSRADQAQGGEGSGSYPPRRLYLLEPGWRVGQKLGNDREFCYMMAPGQDYYHRVYDGEIVVLRGDERLCLACAERRGLLSFAPKGLGDQPRIVAFAVEEPASEIELESKEDLD